MRRALVLFGMTAFVFAVHCGSDDGAVTYSPEDDKRALGELLGSWTDGTTTITFCEDRSLGARACSEAVADIGTTGSASQRCHVAHTDGTSARETLEQSGGCDGPGPPYASLSVAITVSDLGTTAWHGEIDIDSSGSDGYGGSKSVSADTGQGTPVYAWLAGTFVPGKLHATLSIARGFVKPDAGVSITDASVTDADADTDADTDAGDDASIADASTNDASDASTSDASTPPSDAGPPKTTTPKAESRTLDLTRIAGAEACQ